MLKEKILKSVNKVDFPTLVIKKMAVDLDNQNPQPQALISFLQSPDMPVMFERKPEKTYISRYPFLANPKFETAREFLLDKTLTSYADYFRQLGHGPVNTYLHALRGVLKARKEMKKNAPQPNLRELDIKLYQAEANLFDAMEKRPLPPWKLHAVFSILGLFEDYVADTGRLEAVYQQNREVLEKAAKNY